MSYKLKSLVIFLKFITDLLLLRNFGNMKSLFLSTLKKVMDDERRGNSTLQNDNSGLSLLIGSKIQVLLEVNSILISGNKLLKIQSIQL